MIRLNEVFKQSSDIVDTDGILSRDCLFTRELEKLFDEAINEFKKYCESKRKFFTNPLKKKTLEEYENVLSIMNDDSLDSLHKFMKFFGLHAEVEYSEQFTDTSIKFLKNKEHIASIVLNDNWNYFTGNRIERIDAKRNLSPAVDDLVEELLTLVAERMRVKFKG